MTGNILGRARQAQSSKVFKKLEMAHCSWSIGFVEEMADIELEI